MKNASHSPIARQRTFALRTNAFSTNGRPCSENEMRSDSTRLATCRDDFLAAYRLVYETYRKRGYCSFSPHNIVYESPFGTSQSRTIVSFNQDNHLDGALTIVQDSSTKLTIDSLNLPHIQRLRRCGRKLAEVRCLAVQAGSDGDGLATFFALTRFMIQYAYWQNIDDLLLAIHPRHLRFYQRSFNAKPIGSTQHYCAAGNHPAVGCHINLRTLPDFADPKLFCRYLGDPIPAQAFRTPAMSPLNHAYFCNLVGVDASDNDRTVVRRVA